MKTKLLTTLLFVLISAASFAQNALPAADSVLNQAYAQASKENKKVILIFHASWCGWCKKMTASLNDPACKKMFDDNYVTAYLDVLENAGKENLENPGSRDVLKKYNAIEAGLPFWLILDAKGATLADSEMKPTGAAQAKPQDNVGCPSAPDEVAFFVKVLRATSNLTDSDLDVIKARFLQNQPTPKAKAK